MYVYDILIVDEVKAVLEAFYFISDNRLDYSCLGEAASTYDQLEEIAKGDQIRRGVCLPVDVCLGLSERQTENLTDSFKRQE